MPLPFINSFGTAASNIFEFANLAAFPTTGAAGTLYIALDTDIVYYWDTAATNYVSVNASATSPIAVADGIIPQIINNSFVASSVSETTDRILFEKIGRFPSASIDLGPAITLSENGGFLDVQPHTLDETYIVIMNQYDTTGTTVPFYAELAAEADTIIQSDTSQTISGVTSITNMPTMNRQVNSIFVNFASPVTNLRVQVVSLSTNQPIRYYPTELDWNADTGNDFAAGEHEIVLNPPIRLLTTYNIRLDLEADQAIDLLGDGTDPYLKISAQDMEFKNMALEEDNITAVDYSAGTLTLTKQDTSTLTTPITLPTPRTNEQIQDVVDALLQAGTGINLAYDDTANTLTISATGGMVANQPGVTTFAIDLPRRVDINPSPDTVNTQHTVTFNISHHELITTTVLHIGTNTFNLTNPTADGAQTQSVTLSGIDLSVAQTYTMRVVLNGTINSNSQTLDVRNLAQHEFVYYGLSNSNNPDTVDFVALTSVDAQAGQTTITTGTTAANQYFIILIPSDFTLTSIMDTVLDLEVKDAFTETLNVRTISGQTYNSYVVGPLVAGGNEQYILTLT